MAGTDPPKYLLSLILDSRLRNLKGRGVVVLKKQIEELRSELQAVNSELEEAKHLKETTEQEIKGFEVELALNEASIQALELSLNNFSENCVKKEEEEYLAEQSTQKQLQLELIDIERKVSLMDLLDGNKQTSELEKTCASFNEELQKRCYVPVVKQLMWRFWVECFTQMMQIDLLVSYLPSFLPCFLTGNKQTSELEKTCASFNEELQKRCICPSCQTVNVEVLGGMLHANDAN
ncbi:ABC transporter family protein isoform 1 [Hibiscus syriacus]|uniref:ABC transporter family protein isoform 1 n=1 Tax=Hibiscus syriacus TaxID=106335 RepID=A0A6A3AR62_HIBSY|nr:ABC transporter family protein isoform 1 [Hibiscus syriacus]